MPRFLKNIAIALAVLLLALAGFVAWVIYPHQDLQPLPDSLVSLNSAEGAARLARARYRADYDALAQAYQPQALASYCGVASGVTVLGALGTATDQRAFFTPAALMPES